MMDESEALPLLGFRAIDGRWETVRLPTSVSSLTSLFRLMPQDSFKGSKVDIKGERAQQSYNTTGLYRKQRTQPSCQARDKGKEGDFISFEMWYGAKMVLSTRWSSHKGQSRKPTQKIIK